MAPLRSPEAHWASPETLARDLAKTELATLSGVSARVGSAQAAAMAQCEASRQDALVEPAHGDHAVTISSSCRFPMVSVKLTFHLTEWTASRALEEVDVAHLAAQALPQVLADVEPGFVPGLRELAHAGERALVEVAEAGEPPGVEVRVHGEGVDESELRQEGRVDLGGDHDRPQPLAEHDGEGLAALGKAARGGAFLPPRFEVAAVAGHHGPG
jgi:hypothetical protein